MKMIYAIVHTDDSDFVTETLNQNKFSVTKLATTGGFLRKGNTTLMIVTSDDKVDKVIGIIKKECAKREQVAVEQPYSDNGLSGGGFAGVPLMPFTVEVGGATIIVVNVEQFMKV